MTHDELEGQCKDRCERLAGIIGWPGVLQAVLKSPEFQRQLESHGLDYRFLVADAEQALENVDIQFERGGFLHSLEVDSGAD